MTYIFEDWEDDILSLFFQQAYPREVVEKQFKYSYRISKFIEDIRR